MNVPTPASIKTQIEKKKALDSSEVVDSSKSVLSVKEKAPQASSKVPKREFVRPEHLTQRPFKDNEQLQKLKETLPTESDKRAAYSKKRAKDRANSIKIAQQLRDKGMSNVAIGKKMGINESSVRSMLKSPVSNTTKENN